MAEDAVNKAIEVGELPMVPCSTASIAIAGPSYSGTGEPLVEGLPYTLEDVVRAVQQEMARTVEDVLARRTRLLFLGARKAIECAPKTAKIMARELGRDEAWIEQQVGEFTELARGYTAD
jgi:glycerol-3-phosphate dehydrogenase